MIGEEETELGHGPTRGSASSSAGTRASSDDACASRCRHAGPRTESRTAGDVGAAARARWSTRTLRLHTHVKRERSARRSPRRHPRRARHRRLESWGALSDRLVMAHCVWLDDRERALVRRRGAHVCHCPICESQARVRASRQSPTISRWASTSPSAVTVPRATNRMDAFTERCALLRWCTRPRCGSQGDARRSRHRARDRRRRRRARDCRTRSARLEIGMLADVIVVGLDGPHAWPSAGSGPAERIVYARHATDVTDVVNRRARHCPATGAQLVTADLAAIRVRSGNGQSRPVGPSWASRLIEKTRSSGRIGTRVHAQPVAAHERQRRSLPSMTATAVRPHPSCRALRAGRRPRGLRSGSLACRPPSGSGSR